MKQPSILDVVQAIKTVATAHADVRAWWYAPPQRLRLAGELPGSGQAPRIIEVVVEAEAGNDSIPFEQLAAELSAILSNGKVIVRPHRADAEERQLFRVVSGYANRTSDETPSPA